MIKLNEAQRQAVLHHEGPCLVLAGPGSGKTAVLVERIRFLVEDRKADPARILVITYNKEAAVSMQYRFQSRMEGRSLPVHFGTFHAVFYRILQEEYHFRANALMSDRDKISYLFPILNEYQLDREHMEEWLTCISLRKNGFATETLPLPEQVTALQFEAVYEAYSRRTAAMGRMDFDDMLSKCLGLFQQKEKIRKKWAARFTFLLVDEFQDCNVVQYALLKLLSGEARNLFVVGDDDQSIYGFRGACPDMMRRMLRDFPDTKQIRLEANYRCSGEVIEAANKVIQQNKNRLPKTPFAAGERTGREEPVHIQGFTGKEEMYGFLTERIREQSKHLTLEDMAVLFRTNAEAQSLIPFLKRERIPYTMRQGRSKKKHFIHQDVACYLRLAAGDRRRELLFQILYKPQRALERGAFMKEQVDFADAAKFYELLGEKQSALEVCRLEQDLRKLGSMLPYLSLSYLRRQMGYEVWLKKKAAGDQELLTEYREVLDDLQEKARTFHTGEDFLIWLEQGQEENPKGDGKGLCLMTLHASKGLEFSYVCIPNVNEGNLPHGKLPGPEQTEEERRLFYVGMTRAKTALDLLFLTGTKARPRLPSRFLQPLLSEQSYLSDSSTNSSNS